MKKVYLAVTTEQGYNYLPIQLDLNMSEFIKDIDGPLQFARDEWPDGKFYVVLGELPTITEQNGYTTVHYPFKIRTNQFSKDASPNDVHFVLADRLGAKAMAKEKMTAKPLETRVIESLVLQRFENHVKFFYPFKLTKLNPKDAQVKALILSNGLKWASRFTKHYVSADCSPEQIDRLEKMMMDISEIIK